MSSKFTPDARNRPQICPPPPLSKNDPELEEMAMRQCIHEKSPGSRVKENPACGPGSPHERVIVDDVMLEISDIKRMAKGLLLNIPFLRVKISDFTELLMSEKKSRKKSH